MYYYIYRLLYIYTYHIYYYIYKLLYIYYYVYATIYIPTPAPAFAGSGAREVAGLLGSIPL